YEPWKSDGTDAGTSMLANLARDAAPSSDPHNLTAAGDRIYFDAWDGFGNVSSSGEGSPRALWRSDGTPEGTSKLTETSIAPYTPAGTSLFFRKDVLWITDGSPEGTVPATAFVNRFP